jgi:hypothetical protein
MKVVLTLVTMSVLVLGAVAIQCHTCSQVKLNGEEIETGTVACNDASKTTCDTGNDACATLTQTYKYTFGGKSLKAEGINHSCGKKSDEAGVKEICKVAEDKVKAQGLQGLADYDCKVKYCQTELCNSGKVAQMSLLLLAATIGLFGLFF